MVVVGLALCAVAALVHVYVFVLESFLWTQPRTRATFGTTPQDAVTTRPLAFNQGFYNLFLTVEIALGITLFALGRTTVGATLVLVGAGSMVAAGLVLLLSDRSKARPALVQLVPPLLGGVLLVVGLVA